MNEERRMILEMLKDGSISIDEAERLMEAIPSGDTALANTSDFSPKRIYVHVTEGGKSKVNVKIPFSLVRVGLKLGKTFGALGMKNTQNSPEQAAAMEMLQNLDIDEVLNSIGEGDVTLPYTIVDVEDPEKGEHVKVVIE